MDIYQQANEVALRKWSEYELTKSDHEEAVPMGLGLSHALFTRSDSDREEFLGEMLKAVLLVNVENWVVAAVYECETTCPMKVCNTFLIVVWRVKGMDSLKTTVEFKAFLLQWDEDNDRYIVAKSRIL